MFSNAYQSGFISIFYSCGSNPLTLWDKQVKNGHIRRVVDDEVKSLVLEISGTNVATTYLTCPIQPRASLGIKLPFLVMVIKNLKRYFTFEIQILDDKDMRRRFRVSNFQSTTKVRPFCTTMPIGLSEGWNQVQFNLADFTKRAYGSTYMETIRVQIHANVRIRRIYFSDSLYSDDDLPNAFKLFAPTEKAKGKKGKEEPEKAGAAAEASKLPEAEEAPPPPTPAEDNLTAKPEEEVFEPPVPSPIEAPPSEAAAPTEVGEGAPVAEEAPPAPPAEGGEEAPTEGEAEAGVAAEAAPPEGEAPPEGTEESAEAPPTEGEEAAPTEPTTTEEPATTEGETPSEAPTDAPTEAPTE